MIENKVCYLYKKNIIKNQIQTYFVCFTQVTNKHTETILQESIYIFTGLILMAGK